MTRPITAVFLFLSLALVATSCTEDPTVDFGCECPANEVCRNGVCVDPGSDGGGGGTDGGGGDFVDNPSCPGAGIVISEILPRPNADEPEFVELAGPPDRDITGFTLVGINGNGGSDTFTVALNGALGSDGLFLVASAALDGFDLLSEELDMQIGPDSVELRDCGGQVIDAVGYGTFAEEEVFAGEGQPAPAPGQGESLGRCTLGDIDSDDNGADLHISLIPTPGAPNANFEDPLACVPCNADQFAGAVTINEVLYDPEGSDEIENEFIELAGPAGLDALGLELVFVNGSNGEGYSRQALEGQFSSDGLLTIGGSTADVELAKVMQNGPDAVAVLDCEGSEVDKLGYGSFGDEDTLVAEGTPAAAPAAGLSLARCPDGDDTNDNGVDFEEATPSPGAVNSGFADLRACGGTGCAEGILDGRLWISEVVPGVDGFVEVVGEARLGLADVQLVLKRADGTAFRTLTLTGSTDANGFTVVNNAEMLGTGGSVVLLDCMGDVLDAIAWGAGDGLDGEGAPAPALEDGDGLARCPETEDSGDNSLDFLVTDRGTPGSDNGGFVEENACSTPTCEPGTLSGSVIINELAYSPDGVDAEGATFIELRGTPGLALHGAQLITRRASTGATSVLVELRGEIDSDGYFVVGQNLAASPDQTANADLTNTSGGLDLVDCEGVLIDAVGYGSDLHEEIGEGDGVETTGDDQSLARCNVDTLAAADTGDNAKDFHISTTPTPGAANLDFVPRDDGRPNCPLSCSSGALDDRLTVSEVIAGGSGYVELAGSPGLSLFGVEVEVLGGDGSLLDAFSADDEDVLDSAGFFTVATTALPEATGSVVVWDCELETVDALAWGDGGALQGEGDPAEAITGNAGLARCSGGADSGDNATDFWRVTAATPGAANDSFLDVEACDAPDSSFAGQVVINELVVDPVGTDGDGFTFIELKGAEGIVLDDFALIEMDETTGEDQGTLLLAGTIPADGFFVIGANGGETADQESDFLDMTNSNGAIRLVDTEGLYVDSLAYGAATPGVAEGDPTPALSGNVGKSAARCSDGDDNATDFVIDETPTPGAANDACL